MGLYITFHFAKKPLYSFEFHSLSSRHLIHSSCGNGGGYAHSVVRRRRPSPACGHGEGGRPRRLFGAVRGARHGGRGAGGRRQRVELPVQRRRAPLRRARPCAGGRGGAAARVALLRELRFDAPARALAAEEALQPGWLSGLHEKGPRPEPPSGCVLGPANPSNSGVLGPENMSPSSSPEEETPSSTEVEEHPSSRPISTTAATADVCSPLKAKSLQRKSRPSSPSTSPSLTLPQGHLPSPLRTAGRPSAIA
ncbi:uncharacterized protein LOC119289034 isoform X2 [Triticum dicoccoides]|uniref:uncharacterized protein LOC119289034 isoform X2 n=1 Tax=Triticum dicoccoides TaxID=85692 RepID=UPI0018903A38|nr:uncharacterized protein LOC119289034 isoform X2 [Triticum dicoccoides]XP_044380008.1 uncharacterized protein LOC123102655 isoform X2 [Triticum aestivum]